MKKILEHKYLRCKTVAGRRLFPMHFTCVVCVCGYIYTSTTSNTIPATWTSPWTTTTSSNYLYRNPECLILTNLKSDLGVLYFSLKSYLETFDLSKIAAFILVIFQLLHMLLQVYLDILQFLHSDHNILSPFQLELVRNHRLCFQLQIHFWTTLVLILLVPIEWYTSTGIYPPAHCLQVSSSSCVWKLSYPSEMRLNWYEILTHLERGLGCRLDSRVVNLIVEL
jgi:hypothetical protein